MPDSPIRFLDMQALNDAEEGAIKRRITELKAVLRDSDVDIPNRTQINRASQQNGAVLVDVTPTQAEYIGLSYRLAHEDPIWDRIFRAVNHEISPNKSQAYADGLLPTQHNGGGGIAKLTPVEKEIAATFGILVRDNVHAAYALADINPYSKNSPTPVDKRLVNAISLARGEYRGNLDLWDSVLTILAEKGQPGQTATGLVTVDVNAGDWASIAKQLADSGTTVNDIYLGVKVETALSGITGGTDTAAPSSIDIDLPSLDDEATVEIVKDNLNAMQAIYFSSMLEELRLYQVADKLVEMFNAGVLPFGKGKGGDLIFDYWRKSNERFTEVERLNLYARCFGFPGGEPMQSPNREFNDLWLRFVSAVSSYFRQSTVDNLLRATIPAPITQEGLRKAGRDLAANLSLYGYGVAYFAATSLQDQIKDIIEILQTDDVKGAYGARDMWQVVDQVASLELGGARNTVRYRTMAQTGATIVRWLGAHASELSAFGNVIDETEVRRNIKSPNPMSDPTDRDLVDACEQWLAVTGTPDQQVEQYSQPVEAPNSTSVPIQIPQVAKDLLDSVGVTAGVGGR
jgi:hypothetical protein